MDSIPALGLVMVGLIILCVGGYTLVLGGVSLARKLQISSMVIGLTVVAYGTSTPELATAIHASIDSHTDLILGNIIGSNISNVGMVIGIAAMLSVGAGLGIRKRTVRRWIPMMIVASVALVLMSWHDGEISKYDGIALIVGLIAFTIYITLTTKKQPSIGDAVEDEDPEIHVAMFHFKIDSVPKAILCVCVGAGLLFAGGQFTVDGAVAISENLGISQLVIGVVIVAIGTSLPELVTSVIAIRKGQMDIGVGNIIGSNIYNILLIGGIAATIAEIPVASGMFLHYYVMIAFSLVLFVGFRTFIPRYVGAGLVAAFAIYLVWLLLPK
jgi:cation:H+ antiporter